MLQTSTYQLIREHPQLHDLLKTAPLEVIEQAVVESHPTGDFKKSQGELYQDTWLIVSGRVKVYLAGPTGKQAVLDVYDPGMFLGEQEAIIQRPYSASLIYITPVTLLKIPNAAFRTWTAKDHRFADRLIANLCEQLYHLTKRTERYSLYSALQQVGMFCLQRHEQGLPITREAITYEVDSSYRSINRVLKRLTELGVINTSGATIVILQAAQLRQIIQREEA